MPELVSPPKKYAVAPSAPTTKNASFESHAPAATGWEVASLNAGTKVFREGFFSGFFTSFSSLRTNVGTENTRTAPSGSPPSDKSLLPSGENAKALTAPPHASCVAVNSNAPVPESQTRIVAS